MTSPDEITEAAAYQASLLAALGGDDFDHLIAEQFLAERRAQGLGAVASVGEAKQALAAARLAKECLSTQERGEWRIEIDGRPLNESERTAQTMVDADGNTFVRVTAYDLYRLVLSPSVEEHTIRLVARSAGLEAFAFTFGT